MSSSTPTLSNSVVPLNGTQPQMPAAPRTESDPPTNLPGDTQTAGKEGNPENVNDATPKWPGWPGYCVFRIIVPVLKVGSIIGRKGELIKKTCEETRAKIRVLDGAVGTPDRIVLVSGKEEVEAPLSPAMDAVMRIFKRVTGLPETDDRNIASGAEAVAFCSVRLLVASTQAINLIGKQGSSIKSIQENSNASVRVLSENEVPFYASSDERIVELQGEALKVLKALEAVLGHLRKFLVDQSVLPLFEKNYGTAPTQDSAAETWKDNSLLYTVAQTRIHADFPLLAKRDTLFLDRESQLEPQLSSGLSHYGQDTSVSGLRSSMLGRSGAPILISQTMQIPLSYAEDIIGIGGANIAYIRRTSGAILTVQESRGIPEEIMVEIKGTSSQVQTAQQLIQEFISSHKEPSYGKLENGLRSSLSQFSTYTPSSSSSLPTQPYGGYGSSGVGGYSSLRL